MMTHSASLVGMRDGIQKLFLENARHPSGGILMHSLAPFVQKRSITNPPAAYTAGATVKDELLIIVTIHFAGCGVSIPPLRRRFCNFDRRALIFTDLRTVTARVTLITFTVPNLRIIAASVRAGIRAGVRLGVMRVRSMR